MSHIVTIETKVYDVAAVQAACKRIGVEKAVVGDYKVFSETVNGLGVNLNGWNFPVVINIEDGSVKYDNYGGSWGELKELNKFMQAYATEKTKIEARKHGHSVTEEKLADGSIKLRVSM